MTTARLSSPAPPGPEARAIASRKHGSSVRHHVLCYGFALAITLIAGLIRGLLGAQVPGLPPFATFFPAVLAATLVGGLGPGLLSILLGAILSWLFWLQPENLLGWSAATVPVNLALFVIASLALVGATEAARRYHARSFAAEQRFRAAGDVALDGFALLESVRAQNGRVIDFRFAYANAPMQRMLRDGSLEGRRLLQRPPDGLAQLELFPGCARVLATGVPEQAEPSCEADGTRRWFRIGIVRLEDGVVISLRDVTDRKRRETALAESENRFRLLADAVDDVFWIIDVSQQKVVYVSPAYERVWGFSAETLYRDPAAWRQHLHPEDRALVDPAFDQIRAGERETFELVYRIRRPDGSWRWVRDKAWLVRSGSGARVAGIMTDITAEKAAEEKQRLLSAELDHRLRNAFALVHAILRLSARGANDVASFVETTDARIQALARGQDLVGKDPSRRASLVEIIQETLAPYSGEGGRFELDGPAIAVEAKAVPLVHMAFHELAANAAKYGALSVPGGRAGVRWRRSDDDRALELTWTETAGPAVRPPARHGFGSILIEQALARELGGEIRIDFPPDGVTCTMRLPLSRRDTIGDRVNQEREPADA